MVTVVSRHQEEGIGVMRNFTQQVSKRLQQTASRFLLKAFIGFIFGYTLANIISAEASPLKLDFRNGQLTAHVQATSLRQFMAEFEKVSGARVRWLRTGGEKVVSVDCTNLPLSEALRKILGTENFLLFYGAIGGTSKLKEVWISSAAPGASSPPTSGLTSPAVATSSMTVAAPMHAVEPRRAEYQAAVTHEETIQAAIEQQDSWTEDEALAQAATTAAEPVPSSAFDPSQAVAEPDGVTEALGEEEPAIQEEEP
jgi:hypothetical protein